jgi:hypothetical protein
MASILSPSRFITSALLGKYLFKVKCKWENKVRGDLTPPPQE